MYLSIALTKCVPISQLCNLGSHQSGQVLWTRHQAGITSESHSHGLHKRYCILLNNARLSSSWYTLPSTSWLHQWIIIVMSFVVFPPVAQWNIAFTIVWLKFNGVDGLIAVNKGKVKEPCPYFFLFLSGFFPSLPDFPLFPVLSPIYIPAWGSNWGSSGFSRNHEVNRVVHQVLMSPASTMVRVWRWTPVKVPLHAQIADTSVLPLFLHVWSAKTRRPPIWAPWLMLPLHRVVIQGLGSLLYICGGGTLPPFPHAGYATGIDLLLLLSGK